MKKILKNTILGVISIVALTGCSNDILNNNQNKLSYEEVSKLWVGSDNEYSVERITKSCEDDKYYEDSGALVFGSDKERELVCSRNESKINEGIELKKSQLEAIDQINKEYDKAINDAGFNNKTSVTYGYNPTKEVSDAINKALNKRNEIIDNTLSKFKSKLEKGPRLDNYIETYNDYRNHEIAIKIGDKIYVYSKKTDYYGWADSN